MTGVLIGKTIEMAEAMALNGTFEHCTLIAYPPEQMCFLCNEIFEAYFVDTVIWEKLPETLRHKYICPECFRKEIGRGVVLKVK
jgi:hypothetical protein